MEGIEHTHTEQIQANRSTHITREQNQNLRNLEHLERPQNLEKLAVPHARIGLLYYIGIDVLLQTIL